MDQSRIAYGFFWLVLRRFFRSANRSRNEQRLVDEIRGAASRLQSMSSTALQDQANELKERTASQSVAKPNAVFPTDQIAAIALITESVRRVTGKTYYEVQLIAGLKLCQGAIAEIQTGEGKTLITAIPAFVHALSGRGVHVATTNDYLSRRDYELTRPAFRLLGLSTAHVDTDMKDDEKRAAYACDITYGPGYEFGFDYLRDQIQQRKRDRQPLGDRFVHTLRGHRFDSTQAVQRPCAYAIIDEADSVLIDEANTPLVLGGSDPGPQTDVALYQIADEFAKSLVNDTDYQSHRGNKIELTESGKQKARDAFTNLPPKSMSRSWGVLVANALQARHRFHRDVDYVVQDNDVMIVDGNTGRIHDERRWQGGLHQAIEVFNGLEPSTDTITEARITRQRYCQYYDVLCGLTGTAGDSAMDFREFYGLEVSIVPTHRPCKRDVLPTRYFRSLADKHGWIATDAVNRSKQGQPVLVGTRSIRESQAIANVLSDQTDRSFQVLNGVQDQQEADVIANAGQVSTITIATNMAGRGTDIGLSDDAKRLGGLHVIAAEHQESTRVDRQLAGRAARQGDPGSVQFFASAEDKIFEEHSANLATKLEKIDCEQGVCDSDLDNAVRRLQRSIDHDRFASRRQMVARDAWLENIQNTLAKTG